MEETDVASQKYRLITGTRPEMETLINELADTYHIKYINAVHSTLNLLFYAILVKKDATNVNKKEEDEFL